MEHLTTYIERGWVLLPIHAGQKVALSTWKQLQNDPDAVAKTAEFFKDGNKGWNVAVMTGRTSGVVVIDIDRDKLETDPDLFFHTFLEKYPTGLIAETPRKGWHLYYKYPKTGVTIGLSTGSLPKGVDVRGQGGYALVAPSSVKYDNGHVGSYRWIETGEPSDIPGELVSIIKTRSGETTETLSDDLETTLSRILRGKFTEGHHNEEILWAARYMLGQHMPFDAVLTVLLAADALDPTPQGVEAVTATVRSASGYIAASEADIWASMSFLNTASTVTGAEKVNPLVLPLMGLGEYSVVHSVEDRYLVPFVAPMHSLLLMTAPPGSNKTWLLFDLAVTVALGSKLDPDGFLGKYPSFYSEPRNVLIFQQEDQPGKISQRLLALYNAHLNKYDGRFGAKWEKDKFMMSSAWDLPGQIYLYDPANFSFEDADAFLRLEETIKEKNISLVIFDPLYSLGKADNYFSEFPQYLMALKGIRNRMDVNIIIAHHTTKAAAASGTTTRGGSYGSALLDASSEGAILLNSEVVPGQKYPTVTITVTGKAFGETASLTGTLAINTEATEEFIRFEVDDDAAELNALGRHAKVIFTYLRDSFQTLSAAELDRELEIPRGSAARVLPVLEEKGFVTCTTPDKERNRKYQAVYDDDAPVF